MWGERDIQVRDNLKEARVQAPVYQEIVERVGDGLVSYYSGQRRRVDWGSRKSSKRAQREAHGDRFTVHVEVRPQDKRAPMVRNRGPTLLKNADVPRRHALAVIEVARVNSQEAQTSMLQEAETQPPRDDF
eukprot:9476728-Pyramimonas_sp.AAC.1